MGTKEDNTQSMFELMNYNYDDKFGNSEEELSRLRNVEELAETLNKMKVNYSQEDMIKLIEENKNKNMNLLEFFQLIKLKNILIN